MKCPNCQKGIDNDSNFCEYCGTRLNLVPVNNTPKVNDEESKLGCWFSTLSLLIPLVGFILYFKFKDSEIKKAKQAAILAWIGFAINSISIFFIN